METNNKNVDLVLQLLKNGEVVLVENYEDKELMLFGEMGFFELQGYSTCGISPQICGYPDRETVEEFVKWNSAVMIYTDSEDGPWVYADQD